MNLNKFYNKKKILITGHTGFKGSWLVHWLSRYNVKIMGIGLNPDNNLSLFNYLDKKKLIDKRFDIANYKKLEKNILEFKPDIIYHLAAQSLVKKSIVNPLETLRTNILGTANILNCINKLKKKTISVIVTSDKCYQNLNLLRGYREEDRLGGHDPYSASKASAEIVFKSYFNSILKKNKKIRIATARAGNVIGGGDWSSDRLIPDCVKAWILNNKVNIRNPNATRPWQHVLEPLVGYLLLAEKLYSKKGYLYNQAWNFGPSLKQNMKVKKLVQIFKRKMNSKSKIIINSKSKKFHNKNINIFESKHLNINSKKITNKLKWRPRLSILNSVELTYEWYAAFKKKKNLLRLTNNQIKYYLDL